MKTVKLSKNSWHFKLARVTLQMHQFDDMDICQYRSRVLLGLLMLVLCAGLIAILGFGFWHAIFGLIFGLIYGWGIVSYIAEIIYLTCGVIGASTGVMYTYGKFKAWLYNDHSNNDNFISKAYSSWKDKYCAKIELVQE